MLKDYEGRKFFMPDYVQTWRRKLKLKVLVEIARNEIELGTEIKQIHKKLDEEMQIRWNFVSSTRKQYIDNINKILANQYVLNA